MEHWSWMGRIIRAQGEPRRVNVRGAAFYFCSDMSTGLQRVPALLIH